jgi:phage terminase small subunit
VAGTPVKRFKRAISPLDEDGLTPQERHFCLRWLTHKDPVRAMREAFGDTRQSSKKILANPKVTKFINSEMERLNKRHELQAEWVHAEIGKMLRARIYNLVNIDGTRKTLNELDDETAAAIAGIDVEPIYEKDDSGKKVQVGERIKYRWISRTEAAALATRILGTDHGSDSRGADRLKEVVDVFKNGPVPRQIEGEEVKKEEKK